MNNFMINFLCSDNITYTLCVYCVGYIMWVLCKLNSPNHKTETFTKRRYKITNYLDYNFIIGFIMHLSQSIFHRFMQIKGLNNSSYVVEYFNNGNASLLSSNKYHNFLCS